MEPINNKLLNFGEAIEALKQNKKIARKDWNGYMFIVLIPGRKNLKGEDFHNENLAEYTEVKYGTMDAEPMFIRKTFQETIASWIPTTSDCLAEDWVILDWLKLNK